MRDNTASTQPQQALPADAPPASQANIAIIGANTVALALGRFVFLPYHRAQVRVRAPATVDCPV